jgi:hypothetical protein
MAFRNPDYTGSNRCWPCTAVNAIVVGLLSAGIAVIGYEFGAVLVGALGVAAIWMRGYAVPGTPQLTRYLPESVLRLFGKGSSPTRRPTDVVRTLFEAELLAGSEDGSPQLADEARTTYETRTRELAADRERLEDAVPEAFPGVASVSANRGLGGRETWFAKDEEGNTVTQWEARPVVAMDVAGAELLADRVDGWERYEPRKRREAYAVLRQGASTCPSCGGEFEAEGSRSVACCGGRSLTGVLRCPDCNYAVVDTNDLPAAATSEPDADSPSPNL